MRFRLVPFVLVAFAATPAFSADATKGKSAFMKNGCWQCHGELGQGGAAGKTLAPKPMPLEAFNVFVRNSNGPMPPYPKEILSDADLADIHAYLLSIPAAKDYKSIPLLSQ
ncbi:MAG TPA: cytochrome c [Burkholderiales bacterium]|nr:cytochrome c [Burkholderiales bacterium]